MAKNLKINIKNTQIAQAVNLGSIKEKLAKKKGSQKEEAAPKKSEELEIEQELPKEEAPKIKARSKSAFTDKGEKIQEAVSPEISSEPTEEVEPSPLEHLIGKKGKPKIEEIFGSLEEETPQEAETKPPLETKHETKPVEEAPVHPYLQETRVFSPPPKPPVAKPPAEGFKSGVKPHEKPPAPKEPFKEPPVRLGPTGQHIKDFLPPPKPPERPREYVRPREGYRQPPPQPRDRPPSPADRLAALEKGKAKSGPAPRVESPVDAAKGKAKVKEFKDVKPLRKQTPSFDARDRHGLRTGDDEGAHWRRRKQKAHKIHYEETTIRPTQLKVRLPITVKDLASEMKLKASEIIAKLFLNGLVVSINDRLEDETVIQLVGQELGCTITIDTTEEEKIRITDLTIQEEINKSQEDGLKVRAPVVAFMGHVDHGKTSLIDAIRNSKRALGEAGAITQHIGAFRCHTAVGDIAILDTPGHEAFSAMRARGADVTDIVVLVVAGDEGIRQQTLEAIQHARESKNTIVVAINKADKPNFDQELVYRQLSEHDLLPEAWGGQTITINCSAVTHQGITELLEMLALQAEILELRASPSARARGTVLESEMHKGLGAVATVLIQNGTLRKGDSLVCDSFYGRVKTMRDEFGKDLEEATPSTPVSITGLSGLPEAGGEFIVVKTEKEAKEIAEARQQGEKQRSLQTPRFSAESIFQKANESIGKKIFNIILRADVQGSLEAIKSALQKIESKKVDLNIVFSGVGEISESDVQLASTSKATLFGFHTKVESHAELLMKQLGVILKLHDVIYHAVDDVKLLMASILDKLPQEDFQGKAEIKVTFKSSQHGLIAGCMMTEGTIHRNDMVRVKRDDVEVWKGSIASLKRVKEDVREVQKGVECGILLNGFNECKPGDIIEAFQVTYISQEL